MSPKSGCFIRALILIFGFVGFVLALAILDWVLIIPIHIVLLLLFGWISFITQIFPHVIVDPLEIGVFIGTSALFILGLNSFGQWFLSKREPKKDWKPVWGVYGYLLLVCMFVTCMSIAGTFHIVYWMSKEPFITSDSVFVRVIPPFPSELEDYRKKKGTYPLSTSTVPIAEVFPRSRGIDEWGNAITYQSDGETYIIRSLGPNGIIGGGTGDWDDIVWINGVRLKGAR